MVRAEPSRRGMGRLGENCYHSADEHDGARGQTALAHGATHRGRGGVERQRDRLRRRAGRSPICGTPSRLQRIRRVCGRVHLSRRARCQPSLPRRDLLGNSGACYECGHRHCVGDRCVSFNLREDAFAEIAGSGRLKRFSQPMLAASDKLTPLFAAIEGLRSGAPPLRAEELTIEVVETVVGAMSDAAPAPPAPASWEARRVIEVLRYIEERSGEPLDLARMAAMAGLSRHHFLRSFRRLIGMTPYRYLLRVRMARAARRLAATRDPVIAIALEAGFGDLSTFNARFRVIFGTTPSKYRGASA